MVLVFLVLFVVVVFSVLGGFCLVGFFGCIFGWLVFVYSVWGFLGFVFVLAG